MASPISKALPFIIVSVILIAVFAFDVYRHDQYRVAQMELFHKRSMEFTELCLKQTKESSVDSMVCSYSESASAGAFNAAVELDRNRTPFVYYAFIFALSLTVVWLVLKVRTLSEV